MIHTRTILRACAVSLLFVSLILLALWGTGHYPPVALANGGGGGTMRTLTKCSPITGGTITNSPAGNTFANNTVVTLTATPNAGYEFAGWSGAVSGMTNPVQLTMNANKNVCAVFEQIKLTVNKQGNGQVTVDPPGETLTPSFTKTYGAVTNVTLTAIPAAGWAFKEWTGDKTGTANPASILVNRAKTVTAVFEEIKLTVNKSGEGKVSATPPGGAAQTPSFTKYYGTNTTVSLTAIPEPGWAFKEWTGAISSTDNPASVLVNGDKTVSAVFEEIKLTVNKEGNGQVSASPPGLTQSPPFTIEYGTITNVTVTAVPEPGWAFVE